MTNKSGHNVCDSPIVQSSQIKPLTEIDSPAPVDGVTATPIVFAPSRFSTQIAWTVVVRSFMIAGSLVVGIIAGRWLGAGGFGVFAILNLIVSYAMQMGNLGLVLANTYYVAHDRVHLVPATVNALVFSLVWGSIAALLTLGLVTMTPGVFGDIPLKLVGVAALSIPFQMLTLFGLNILLALGLIERLNALDLISQLLLVLNAFVALIVLHSGLWMLVSFNTAAAVLVSSIVFLSVLQIVSTVKQANQKWRGDFLLFGEMMRYAAKIHLQTMASLLLFRADLLIVKYFRGASEAGVYAVASQVGLLLMLVPTVISTLLFPRVAAERDPSGALACRTTRHAVVVMIIVCVVALPGLFALPLLYGAPFTDARVQALILLPGVFLVSIACVLTNHFSGTGLPIAIPLFWIATFAMNVILDFSVVPTYGARGAAFSSALSYTLIFLLIALYFRARTGNSFRVAFVISKAEMRQALGVFNRTA